MRISFRNTVIAVAMLVTATGFALPAQAADRDGTVNPNELGFFYLSKAYTGKFFCTGSISDFASAKKTLNGYTFFGPGAGAGQAVKNNATCAYNYRNVNARVYFNSYCAGPYDQTYSYEFTDLDATRNDNASFKWLNGFDCSA